MEWMRRNVGALRVAAVAVPLVVSGLLFLLGALVSGPAAALVLVLLVVGAAATGDRYSGVLAALASAAGFDFFLTAPYLDLHIENAEDVELAVLLLLVGLAVNELALWGARQQASASERGGFISGVLEAAELASRVGPGSEAVDTVAGHIRHTLTAERVTYLSGPPSLDAAVVQRDGSVTYHGASLNVAADGLPKYTHTAVPVIQGERAVGHFQVTTATRLSRPRPEQLRIAVLLADQIARRRIAVTTTLGR
jgi:K+-sensing histidine kinase KdpD